MTLSSAFGTQGSTPAWVGKAGSSAGSSAGSIFGSTPAANALNRAQSPAIPSPAPAPVNQSVKKQTITTAGGDTHVTEYNDPNASKAGSSAGAITGGLINQTSQPPAPTFSSSGGAIIPTGGVAGTPVAQPTDMQKSANPAPQTSQDPYKSNIAAAGAGAQGLLHTGNQMTSDAYAKAQQYQAQLEAQQEQEANALGAIGSSPIPLEFQQGRAAVVQGQEAAIQAAQAAALQGESNLANIGNTRAIAGQTGLINTGSLAQPSSSNVTAPAGQVTTNTLTGQQYSNPVLSSPGQQFYQPTQAGNGSAESGAGITPDVMNSYAQMAANGQLSQVPTAITSNPVLNAQLNAAAKTINPNYNPVLSQASGTTQAQGQQLQTQSTAAKSALDTLQGLYNNLGQFTGGTGFNPLNSLEQSIAGLFGNNAVGQYQTTLQEARAKVAGVLSTSGGITPTNADQMAKDYLPDGMTPSQLPGKITAAKTLIDQTVNAFTQSGQQSAPAQTTTGGVIHTSYGTIDPTL